MTLKNKHILITTGPTWVLIDKVRVISNMASGETGRLLAEHLSGKGAKVTLLSGPGSSCCCISKKIKIIPFKFFDELRTKAIHELKTGKYAAVIHAAAVSDYQPESLSSGKIKSGLKNLKINLVPTPKIIDQIKKVDPDVFLVGFKFEPGADRDKLRDNAHRLIRRTQAELVVANTVGPDGYRAYFADSQGIYGPVCDKKKMVIALSKIIMERI